MKRPTNWWAELSASVLISILDEAEIDFTLGCDK
jgi:hypothetical protein